MSHVQLVTGGRPRPSDCACQQLGTTNLGHCLLHEQLVPLSCLHGVCVAQLVTRPIDGLWLSGQRSESKGLTADAKAENETCVHMKTEMCMMM